MKEPTGSPPPPLSLWMTVKNISNGSPSRALTPLSGLPSRHATWDREVEPQARSYVSINRITVVHRDANLDGPGTRRGPVEGMANADRSRRG